MSLVYIVKFRTDRGKYEQLLQEAKVLGFATISNYLRHRLNSPMVWLEKISKENNTLLKQITQQLTDLNAKPKQ